MGKFDNDFDDVLKAFPVVQEATLFEFETMERNMYDLLNSFVNDQLTLQELLEHFKDYFNKHERFLYSSITPFLIGLNNVKREFLLQKFMEISHSKEITTLSEEMQVKFLKLYDHVNLVISQNANFNTPREHISKIVNEETRTISQQINKVSKKARKDIESSRKELYTQLISIVSIFVAISFVMFGGMSLLNNLFDYSEMTSIPLLEMICGGSLIGIIIIIAIYVFVILMLMVTGRIQEDRQPYESVVKWACIPLGVLCVLTLGLWFLNIRNINDVKRINIQCKIVEQNEEKGTVTMICPSSESKGKKE